MTQFSSKEINYLKIQMVGRIATASKSGAPHVVPVCFASDTKAMYIHAGLESKKMRNIVENDKVAFVVDDWISWEKYRAVFIQGIAKILGKGGDYDEGKRLLYGKYPKFEEEYPIIDGKEVLIQILPSKILNLGLD